MSPEQQAAVTTTAIEIADHVDAAKQHLMEAFSLLVPLCGHPDGPDVAEAMEEIGHGELSLCQLLLLAGDVRAKAGQITGKANA